MKLVYWENDNAAHSNIIPYAIFMPLWHNRAGNGPVKAGVDGLINEDDWNP